MQLFLLTGIIAGLSLIAYQDFRYRYISLWALLLLMTLSIVLSLSQTDFRTYIYTLAVTLLFITFQLATVYIYFRIRKKTKNGFINSVIGSGDIMFLLIPAMLFSTINFIIIYTISMLIIVVIYVIYNILN